jgi:hypothetical protein
MIVRLCIKWGVIISELGLAGRAQEKICSDNYKILQYYLISIINIKNITKICIYIYCIVRGNNEHQVDSHGMGQCTMKVSHLIYMINAHISYGIILLVRKFEKEKKSWLSMTGSMI